MLDVMKVMDDDRVHISFTGAMSPIIVTPENNKSVLHLILPYRTTN
jgi:DNA polymerase-3 subunit beta